MIHRITARKLGLVGGALVALAVIGALFAGSTVYGQQATVDGGTWSFNANSTGNVVSIKLTGVPSAGLGAADVSVAFDSSVLKITNCDTGDLQGACNANAPAGPARAAGFAAPAITTEPVVVATITFDCIGSSGSSSALTLTVNEAVDGTAGEAQDIVVSAQNGTVICGAAAPPATGSAPPEASGDGTAWIIVLGIALLAGAAALGLGVFGVRRLRRRV